jgi:glycosyltransferase involved in cell wall biosynthesis
LIFGPVGGGESSPRALRKSLSPKGKLVESIRDLFNVVPRFDPFWQTMLRRCARVVVKTEETRARLPQRIRQRAVLALENMVLEPPYLAGELDRVPPLKLLYAGRLLPWKGVHLALKALAHLGNNASVTFTIVGKGPEESCLKEQVRNFGLQDIVRFVEWMPKSKLHELYSSHDALLFPSLHDSGGTVVMEALAHGRPVICLALGGPAVTVDDHCARVVSTKGKTEAEVVEGMATFIQEFADMPASAWREMRIRAVRRARYYTPQSVIDRVYGPLLKGVENSKLSQIL